MAILMGGVLVFGLGYLVMLLWNAVMPALLGVAHIGFWRSVGLLILARLLVGGFHHGGLGHRRFGHRGSWRQYEEWWREAGEQSYRDFSTNRTGGSVDEH
jgi:hypothetical protein